MDDFARQPEEERRQYFDEAAARRGLLPQIIEKDFWVCWTLRRLFSLEEFRDHLTFKGGTTLSKVYGVIERFSEDVDVAIEREFLGFGGDEEPEKGGSGKERERRLDRLRQMCQTTIAERLQPQLRDAIAVAVGTLNDWSVSLDPDDPDQQSLLFQYPPAIRDGLSPYFAPSVKVELGARSDHFPLERADVTPYVGEEFPDAFSDAQVPVRVLVAARTFWEKALILHQEHHGPEHRNLRPRLSRHYYDVYRLSQSPVLQEALAKMDLLERVAIFKDVYFRAGWARYDEARTGSLRLSPPDRIAAALKEDYRRMRPMFFTDPPPMDEILAHLPTLEAQINETKGA